MTPEQKTYYDKELASIRRGGCSHDVWPCDGIGGMGLKHLGPVDPPVVGMSNDEDGHYTQFFQNRAEVEAFIAELRVAADQAWGRKE